MKELSEYSFVELKEKLQEVSEELEKKEEVRCRSFR